MATEIFERRVYKDRDEWFLDRKTGIGGSEAGAVLGISKWKTRSELWQDKTNRLPKYKEIENSAIKYGKVAEGALRVLFGAKFEEYFKIYHNGLETLVRKDKPYLRASLDGEIEVLQDIRFTSYDGNSYFLKKGMKGVLEIKTKQMPKAIEWKTDIPRDYFAQGVHNLNVTNYDFIIFVAELRYPSGSSVIRNFCFMANNLLNDMVQLELEEDKFWKQVKKEERVAQVINI